MAEEPPRKKKVRFDLANLKLRTEHDLGAPVTIEPHKKVEVMTDSPNLPEPQCTQPVSYTTLLDTDTSLATPLDESPSSILQQPGSSLAAPLATDNLQPPIIAPYITLLDIDTSLATHHPSPSLSAPLPTTPPTNTPPPPSTTAPSPSSIPLDAGESDAHGNVLQASTEACAECGGKIVWATKGEWLLVCERCGDVQ